MTISPSLQSFPLSLSPPPSPQVSYVNDNRNNDNNPDNFLNDDNVTTTNDNAETKIKVDKDNKKKVKKYRILQMNKGTADFQLKQDLVKFNIKENDADITLITEANHDPNDISKTSDIKKTFKGYKIEESLQSNNPRSRCLMIIKNSIQYERMKVDDEENPIVAICVKTKKN